MDWYIRFFCKLSVDICWLLSAFLTNEKFCHDHIKLPNSNVVWPQHVDPIVIALDDGKVLILITGCRRCSPGGEFTIETHGEVEASAPKVRTLNKTCFIAWLKVIFFLCVGRWGDMSALIMRVNYKLNMKNLFFFSWIDQGRINEMRYGESMQLLRDIFDCQMKDV